MSDLTPEEEVEAPDADEVLAQLEATYNPPEEDEPEDDDEVDTGIQNDSVPEDDSIDIDGLKLSKSEIHRLHTLEQYLNDNPAVTQTLENAYRAVDAYGRPQALSQPDVSQPTTPEAPEGIDLDDPSVKALWERTANLESILNAQQSELTNRRNVEITGDVNRAVADWKERYHFDDQTMVDIGNKAAELGVAAALLSQGRPTYDAVNSALEAAFWSMPKYRDQFLSAQATVSAAQESKDKARKAKLSALGGKGTTVSARKPPSQMTEAERREAMIAEIAQWQEQSR